MAREIKFRGKIVMDIESLAMKKGHWVEGHYYEDLQDGEWCSWIKECNDIIHYKVDKDTLGQFTGLLDKNGKEIYEGDIIQFQFTQSSSCSSKLFLSEQFIGIITIDKWNNHIIKSNGLEIHISNACEYGVVIGNIHDTPELLKTEAL